jgi:hypothetical protein
MVESNGHKELRGILKSFASGRADCGLTAISSRGRFAPRPKGRSKAKNADFFGSRGMAEAQA